MALIIIVDDVAAMRKALSLFVRNAGHEAIEASNGEEALVLARQRVPDLIVSDILMPGMDGFEFVRQLRADPIAGNAHVVFHSAAYSEQDARRLAHDCGVFHVVPKPAKPEVILNAIEAALKSPQPIPHSQPLSEFTREHQRLVSNKLVEKVAALETTTQRLRSVLMLGQELAVECEPWRLLSDFSDQAKVIVSAKYAAVGIIEDGPLSLFLSEVTVQRKSIRFSAINPCPYSAEEIAAAFNLEENSGSIVALAAAPIATASQVYGWLCFGEKLGSDEFTEEDEQIAITLGAQLGLAYENALRLQSIRRHANELEDRIRDRTVELHRSNQALEQFASTAAHDLQAPLNTVIGYMQQLRKQRAKPFDADTSESMEAVFTAAKRMQQFVRDALDYSRLGGANAPLHSTESSSAMERALDNLAADISANGASIICEQLPTVNADESQLTQLFQNLIHNAMKFCNRAKPCIHVWAESAGNKWVFAVKDNGIGIAPADFERVFNLFTRLNGRDEYSGSGIGLAVCKKIIARHGGRIWIESAVGEGTTIHFTLTASTDVETPMRMPIQSELHEENLELARG